MIVVIIAMITQVYLLHTVSDVSEHFLPVWLSLDTLRVAEKSFTTITEQDNSINGNGSLLWCLYQQLVMFKLLNFSIFKTSINTSVALMMG